MKPRFFKNAHEFRKWLMKNHAKENEIWLGFYKGHVGVPTLTQKEAVDQGLCFGWTYGVLKRIDHDRYMMRFVRRKPKSTWSAANMKRVKELQKLGLMQPSGLASLKGRNRETSEEVPPRFSASQLKKFKADEKAWSFFTSQTPSYQKYMTQWVISPKREETKLKRLSELIKDSANGTKLRRILEANERMQEKLKIAYKPGETPIEVGKNLGPIMSSELRSVGIDTVEKLRSMGWEKVLYRLCESYPHRINLNMAKALIGAIENQKWLDLDPDLKAEAKAVIQDMKINLRRSR